jgi:hypothetical protein
VRGVAIDADSNVWAGTYNGHTVWKVHPSAVDNTQSPPRCQILGSLDVTDPVYGLAIDGSGYLWTSWNPTRKVDTHTIQLADTPVAHNYWYGIAVDGANHVWFGGWSGSGDMHRVDGDPPHNILSTGATGVTAVTVHPDGTVWGSRYGAPFGVEKITLSADGATVVSAQNFVDPCADPSYTCENHGVAVDHVGKIWSSQRFAGRVNRWLTDGTHEGLFDVDPGYELYTYSDMTGIQLRTFTIHEGHWLQTFDSGYLTPIWDHVEWTAVEPLGTAVSVQIRAADHEADFAAGTATAWCGPFTASPGVLQPACAVLNGHRWVQVDVKLSTTANGVKPTVSDVKVAWSY